MSPGNPFILWLKVKGQGHEAQKYFAAVGHGALVVLAYSS